MRLVERLRDSWCDNEEVKRMTGHRRPLRHLLIPVQPQVLKRNSSVDLIGIGDAA